MLAHTLPGRIASAIFVIGGEHLVAGLQIERARHHIHARGGIGDEDQMGSVCTEELRQPGACLRQQCRGAAAEELHRIALHLAHPLLLRLEHLARAGTE